MNTPPVPADFYSAAGYCAEESVGYLMKRIMVTLVDRADRRLEVHGLTSAQWGPLLRIHKDGSATVAELARWNLIDPGAMTRTLDRLEKKGLCRRERSTGDRRVVRVELTPAGSAAIAEVPAVLAAVMNELLAGFSRDEWLLLKGLLQRMAVNGEALREAPETFAAGKGQRSLSRKGV